jgi:peptide-methionine (R)-S-oxide reductase
MIACMNRVITGGCLIIALALLGGCAPKNVNPTTMNPTDKAPAPAQPSTIVTKTDAEWRQQLTPEQYHVLRESGTERAFGKAYEEFKQQGGGTYYCAGCNAELFSSDHKFDSHCGWPSFYDPANAKNVRTIEDRTAGMLRVEVRCSVCDGHLGHVFKGEGFKTPTDQRYCINGVALKFVPKGDAKK